MTHTRGFPAIIATLVLAFAFAACGSDDNSSSSAASGGGSSELGRRRRRREGGSERLKPFEATPTEINAKEPLKGAPARRQDPRHARDERPEQPEAAEVAEGARRAGEVELRRRQLRPRQPGDVQRRDRHGDHEEGRLHRRGRHPAHARDDQEGPGRRREVGADVRAPGRGQGPDHRQRERVRQRRADGQGPRRLLHLRLQGQGQRRHRARPGVSDPRAASPTASRPRSRRSARTAR